MYIFEAFYFNSMVDTCVYFMHVDYLKVVLAILSGMHALRTLYQLKPVATCTVIVVSIYLRHYCT